MDSWQPVNIASVIRNGGVSAQVTLKDFSCTLGDCNPITPGLQSKFAGVNLKSELDSPGVSAPQALALCVRRAASEFLCSQEYYIDKARTLFFLPPIPLEQWGERGVFITSSLTATHITADHVTLRGLTIRHARGNGVLALNVSNVRVENCTVSAHGQHGVVIVGDGSGVTDSSVYSVGCSGVRVAGGDAHSLTPGRSFVKKNTIFDFALWKRTYSPGIYFGGIGNDYIANNISNSPHNCISGGGNVAVPWGWTGSTASAQAVPGSGSEITIEGNHLDSCTLECGDVRP